MAKITAPTEQDVSRVTGAVSTAAPTPLPPSAIGAPRHDPTGAHGSTTGNRVCAPGEMRHQAPSQPARRASSMRRQFLSLHAEGI